MPNVKLENNKIIGDIRITNSTKGLYLKEIILSKQNSLTLLRRKRKIDFILNNKEYIEPTLDDIGIRFLPRCVGKLDDDNNILNLDEFITFVSYI